MNSTLSAIPDMRNGTDGADEMPTALSRALRTMQAENVEQRMEQQQWQPFHGDLYYPDNRLNSVTFQRGNSVIAAWRSYDFSRIHEDSCEGLVIGSDQRLMESSGSQWELTKERGNFAYL